jgi:hypothetical protein
MELGEQVGFGKGKCLVQAVQELGEQVGFGKGKCLVQAVQEFVRPRNFVTEEGACVQEKVVT